MAGLGRRSHYRKHLTDSVLNDFPEPSQNERIAKVLGTRGSNQFELVVADSVQNGESNSDSTSELDMTPQLAILPTKFRKLVWLKRNDYVICVVAKDESENDDNQDKTDLNTKTVAKKIDGGIRYMIQHILYKDQVKHLKEKGLWPKHPFFLDQDEQPQNQDQNADSRDHKKIDDDDDGSEEEDEDGIVYNDINDEYFCNMNRIAKLKIDDSSDESDGDSD